MSSLPIQEHENKLSVIIPVYNMEKYISRCLDSIICQTYSNLEIICIDDGSTDRSYEILKEYASKDKRIVIFKKENGGRSSARNTGLCQATGRYVSFIDSDDEIKKDTYQNVMNVFTDDIDVVWFGVDIRYNVHSEMKSSDNSYYRIKFSGKHKINDEMLLKSDCSAWNKIFRLDTIKQNDMFFEGLIYEDFIFHHKIFSILKNVYFIKDKYYIYYRNEKSIMSNTFEKRENTAIHHIYALDYIYNFFYKKNILNDKKKIFEKLCLDCFYFAIIHSPVFEKSRCIWEMTKRLRSWDIEIDDTTLNQLKNGSNELFLIDIRTYDLISIVKKRIYSKISILLSKIKDAI